MPRVLGGESPLSLTRRLEVRDGLVHRHRPLSSVANDLDAVPVGVVEPEVGRPTADAAGTLRR